MKQEEQNGYFRRESMAHLKRSLEAILATPGLSIPPSGLYFCSDTLLAWTPREFNAFVAMYSDFAIPFIAHTTPETLSEQKLSRLRDCGLRVLNVGIQHGDEQFRRAVLKRSMGNQRLLEAMRSARDSGVFISADAIVGFPTETPELAERTVEFMNEIPAQAKNASIFVPYHGTDLREIAEKLGFIRPGTLARWQPDQTQLDMPGFSGPAINRIRRRITARALHTPLGR